MNKSNSNDVILEKLRDQASKCGQSFHKSRRFSKEFKKSVIDAKNAGLTLDEINGAAGISNSTISRWNKEYGKRKPKKSKSFERLDVVSTHVPRLKNIDEQMHTGEFIFPTGLRFKVNLLSISSELLSQMGINI